MCVWVCVVCVCVCGGGDTTKYFEEVSFSLQITDHNLRECG